MQLIPRAVPFDGRPLPIEDVRRVLRDVADALDFAHAAGVVHRDVKPANIAISRTVPTGRIERVSVLDFGISKQSEATALTESGALLGSVAYVAPELVRGEPATPASDQYSLACTIFEFLTGHRPFPGESLATILYAQAHGSVPSLGDGLVIFDDVIQRALAKDPSHRFASCGDFADEFERDLLQASAPTTISGPANQPPNDVAALTGSDSYPTARINRSRLHIGHAALNNLAAPAVTRFNKLYRTLQNQVWWRILCTVLFQPIWKQISSTIRRAIGLGWRVWMLLLATIGSLAMTVYLGVVTRESFIGEYMFGDVLARQVEQLHEMFGSQTPVPTVLLPICAVLTTISLTVFFLTYRALIRTLRSRRAAGDTTHFRAHRGFRR